MKPSYFQTFLGVLHVFLSSYIKPGSTQCYVRNNSANFESKMVTLSSRDFPMWVKPGADFRYVKFSLIKDTRFDFNDDVEHNQMLFINKAQLVEKHWNKIDFHIYEDKSLFTPDFYAVEARINGMKTVTKVTNLWWIFTVIRKINVYVSGEAEVSFECQPPTTSTVATTTHNIIISTVVETTTNEATTTPKSDVLSTEAETTDFILLVLEKDITGSETVRKNTSSTFVVVATSVIAVLLLLCAILISVLLLYRKVTMGKLKKLGGNDLSTIESIDPKNMINHYEEVLKYGKKDNKDYEEQKVKQDAMKDIQWNVANELSDSKSDQKEDEFCYDKPKSVLSEAEETIYEELPDDLKP